MPKISNISDNIYSSDNSSSPSLDEATSHQESMHHINYSTSTSDTEIPSFDLPEHRCSSPFLQDISDVSLSDYVKEADTSLEKKKKKNHEDMGNWSLDSQRPHFVATQEEFESKKKLNHLGFKNISFILGDGHIGFPNNAPYDAIIITAVADDLPETLVNQLSPTGRIVLPLMHKGEQKLTKLKNTKNGIIKKIIEDVVFVPMLKGVENT
mgnify:CR=1 FL=1